MIGILRSLLRPKVTNGRMVKLQVTSLVKLARDVTRPIFPKGVAKEGRSLYFREIQVGEIYYCNLAGPVRYSKYLEFFLTHDGYPTTMTSLTLGDAPTGECDNHWCLQTLRCEWCHLSAQELAGGFVMCRSGGGRWEVFLRLHIIHHHCCFWGKGLKSCFFD